MPVTAEQHAPHPLFEKYASRQWTGSLPDLFQRLKKEARETKDGGFAWRVLPRGAVVGMRLVDLRHELRIARSERTTTPDQERKFDRECQVFVEHFGMAVLDGTEPAPDLTGYWFQMPPHGDDHLKTARRWRELRKGETEPGKALCGPCREAGVATPTSWKPGAGVMGQACMSHAFQAGKEYAREVLERLGRR